MSERFGRRLLLGLLLGAPALARADSADPATAPLASFDNALLDIMRAGTRTPFQQRYTAFAPVLARTFDLPLILHTVIGPRWPGLPADQQDRLGTLFTAFTGASYVASFDSYNGQRFDIVPETRPVGGDRVVATRIIRASGEAVKIDYVMRDAGGGWRVVDVLLDGSISRVAVLRSDFRALIGPSDASRLIDSLRGKIADLSGGTLTV